MAWARISDDFLDHPKVAELTVDADGLAALGLWTSALCWVRADRRRAGRVPTGIAVRYSAGRGTSLAERLVAVGLWEQTEGGYLFHDFEDVYTPSDLSEKRAQAGRAGGKASGRTRAAQASTKPAERAKQVASSKNPAKRTESQPQSESLFDDDDPLTEGSSTESAGSKPEAKPKQLASSGEAKQAEASHARAGATTHYPEASNEASSSAPPASTPDGETLDQRVNRLTRTYTDAVKFSNFPAIRSIVKKAIGSGDYTDEQITGGLAALADERDTVTTNTLRFAIEGLPKRMTQPHINRPYQAQKVNHEQPGAHAASWERRRAAHAQQQ
ncbi:hypothetical protein ACIODS_12390 [Micromonospora chalcea]|uniref:hypothetical protein n=1 Tax=Micromonospora chalcea TaxID=1874 RepID=UPI00381D09EB